MTREKENRRMTDIYYWDEVYKAPISEDWKRTRQDAALAGFKYFMPSRSAAGDLRLSPRVYKANYKGYYDTAGLPVCSSLSLKTRSIVAGTSFKDAVMEFVLSPDRSAPDALLASLAGKGFLSSSDARQKAIVNDLLASDSFCPDGKKKFRQHMGDLLEPETTTYVLEITIPKSNALSVDVDAAARDVRCALHRDSVYYTGVTVKGIEKKK